MAEIFGRVDGTSGGRGGSMHIFDAERRFMGGYGIVGGNLPIAAGLAPRLPVQGRRRGHRLHVRRRRLQHRQLRRDDEPGGAVDAAGPLPGREQPLRDGDGDRAPLGPDRPLEEGRGLRRSPGRGSTAWTWSRCARAVAEGLRDGARGGTADADRGRHLPLPRPLRRRPGGLPGARGGRGVARERPDRELRPALRRGGRAGRARGRAGARRGRGRRCSRRSSSPTPRRNRRSTRCTRASTR